MSVGSPDDEPTDNDAGDGIWMTKAQLATVRRISVASADRLIRRQGWRKEPGNDGRARVLIPRIWAQPPKPNPTDKAVYPKDSTAVDPKDKPDKPADDPTDVRRAISELAAAVALFGEQKLVQETGRADKAEARVAEIEAQVGALRTEIQELRSRADRAESTLEAFREARSTGGLPAWLRRIRDALR